MDLGELKRLVRQGEGLHLEFKRKAHHPDKIARELVAFANTEGGVLLVGVDDDRTVYGLKYPGEDAFALRRFLDGHCTPALPYSLSQVPVTARREVLILQVRPGRRKPYYLTYADPPGGRGAFVRVADKSVTASREMIQVLRHAGRERGVSLRVGEPEQVLLRHLEERSNITLADTQKLLGISRRQASAKLVLLVRAGLLNIHPSERGDTFSLVEEAFDF
ncbi:MAG: ATP-binding protein [Bacteroidetes bacterium]|nr:MAG: ATP-binding protein [Bacteroidota bacterium]